MRITLVVFFLSVSVQFLDISKSHEAIVNKGISLAWVSLIVMILTKVVLILEHIIVAHWLSDKQNYRSRAIHTQVMVFKRVLIIVIWLLSIATMLLSFDQFRQLGTSLLASAGIAGIIFGFAAQKTLSSLLAGLQMAMTQPIRVDDVVIVENEWGWIEEITFTYVVVRIWDLRRLVIPITYFFEKPFQNWTRQSADIMGTVFIYADYTIPIDAIRAELTRIVSASELWDGKVCGLQVTNATQQTIELRCLVSSKDAPTNWDLRCMVREKIIEFIQKTYPLCLPKLRAELKEDTVGQKLGQHL